MESLNQKYILKYPEFYEIIQDILENEKVKEMKKYRQHYDVSCYEHCYNAAYLCYKICKKLKLDYKSCTRAAMLHDMFLYDWRVDDPSHRLHAFSHGKVAFNNASQLFELNKIEKDVIINHMWPVTVKIPKTKECFILTLVDKYCATTETFNGVKNSIKKRRRKI